MTFSRADVLACSFSFIFDQRKREKEREREREREGGEKRSEGKFSSHDCIYTVEGFGK